MIEMEAAVREVAGYATIDSFSNEKYVVKKEKGVSIQKFLQRKTGGKFLASNTILFQKSFSYTLAL